ncbi:MAG TPA: NAD(P)/FAD-dependent oxidoreductase [Firmicutes bacterium]|nr:NAD(P)/FAD-dependent oxidoreductase [Bacillota bacterium]
MTYDLIVVGGGPAGMLGAATAAANGLKVLLLEKNEKLGKKLYITGKGRCNVTNYGDIDDFTNNIVTNPKFLYGALNAFDNHQLITLLNSLNVKTKVERGNRVFPVSDKSSDVIKALEKHLLTNKVTIRLNTPVKRVLVLGDNVCGVLLADDTKLTSNKVLLATGGMSYSQTGSTGDGYKMAQELGHTIIQLRPALVPLETKEPWVKKLQGLTLKNVQVQALVKNKVKTEQFGELLFTHFGVSGPVVLTISSIVNKYLDQQPIILNIDLKPALSREQLGKRIQRDFIKYAGKHLKNAMDDLLPRKMIPVLLALSGVDIHKQVDQITREERDQLVYTFKNIRLTVHQTGPLNEAIVTSGGISTKEVNSSTMESKIIKGLHFAGEIIDIDALTGGYNLQLAFSTGYLSGISAATDTGS